MCLFVACTKQKSDAIESQNQSNPSFSVENNTLNGTNVSQENIGGDFELTDGSGQLFRLSQLRGKIVLLSFGYTHCPDVCPTELFTYAEAISRLDEALQQNVKVVFVSVDPQRDTPDLIGQYVQQFHSQFIGLTATENQDLSRVKKLYHVISNKVGDENNAYYTVDHSSGGYILDKNGKVRLFEPYGLRSEQIAHDLSIILTN